MSLRKIADAPRPCLHPGHSPPSMIVLEPGTYEHTCPGCGAKKCFIVEAILCGTDPIQPGETPRQAMVRGYGPVPLRLIKYICLCPPAPPRAGPSPRSPTPAPELSPDD